MGQIVPGNPRPVILLAQDEGRFGRISVARRAWAPPGERPLAPRQVVRESLYVFAAVCPALGRMSALILPYANTDMMNLFLHQVAADFSEYFILMLADQAGWHCSRNLRLPANLRLLPLPAHSPELNPAELLWRELRNKEFANVALDDLDQVEATLCAGLNRLAQDPDKLRSLTFFPYLQNVTFVNAN